MRIQTARLTAGVLLACAAFVAQTSQAASPTTTPSTPSAQASTASSLEAEQDAAFKAAKAVQKVGPVDITLRDQAHLHLPTGYVWVPTPAAAQLMRSMGNRTDDTFIGAIFPADDADWMAVVKFVKEGYIKDDDAKDWNADDLLKSLKEGTEAANEERAKRGIPSIEVTGWAQKPQYDASSHRLVWSALSKRKGATDGNQGVNYNTYALGREGYLSLNLITNAKDLDKYKPDASKLLGAIQYDDGKKYADFNSSTDKVAAYGLAALVAGAAVKKLGLFAIIAAFLAKFAKLAVVAGGAALWGIAKLFKRNS
ncbi:UNVERIFIED_ORG: putative membrane-anchored protein [Variovorax paradoxus]|nr:putative membrane-anchored protein [Variovorax paradoxus]